MKRIVAMLFGAVLLGVPAGLLAGYGAFRLQPEPDPVAVAAEVYPGRPAEVDADVFRRDESGPALLRFMNGELREITPYVAPKDQPPTGAPEPVRAKARADLEAAGWRIGPGLPDSYAFTAAKGHAEVDFYADTLESPETPNGLSTWFILRKAPDWRVGAAAIACGLAGAVLGAWLARWALNRSRQRGARTRLAVGETVLIGTVLTIPAYVQLTGLEFPLLKLARWPALLGVVLIAGALLLLVRRRAA